MSCQNGHAVAPTDSYCPTCGMPLRGPAPDVQNNTITQALHESAVVSAQENQRSLAQHWLDAIRRMWSESRRGKLVLAGSAAAVLIVVGVVAALLHSSSTTDQGPSDEQIALNYCNLSESDLGEFHSLWNANVDATALLPNAAPNDITRVYSVPSRGGAFEWTYDSNRAVLVLCPNGSTGVLGP